MKQLSIKITVLFLFCWSSLSWAQMSSNGFYTEQTAYAGSSPNDPIFFYEDINTATISAPSGLNYQWYSYSTTSQSFELLSGETNPNLTNISENGYKVTVENSPGSFSDYYCWNFVPAPQLDSIAVSFFSCINIKLTAYTKLKILSYYDHLGDNSALEVDYGFSWSSTPTGDASTLTEYTGYINAPFEDTEYKLEVGAKFAPTIKPVSATCAYEAIAVDAKFSFEAEGVADNESPKGSAPMVVRFKAESSEGEILSQGPITDWEWTFGEEGKDYVPDPIFTFQDEGKHSVVLTVRNIDTEGNEVCASESVPEIFEVIDMVIKVPNAFTPFSSPGENDQFRIAFRSIRKYNIIIYNRWGRRVYQSDDPETGWDGRIGSRRAEPGVYFYQIDAEGFNKDEKLTLDGVVHLIVN